MRTKPHATRLRPKILALRPRWPLGLNIPVHRTVRKTRTVIMQELKDSARSSEQSATMCTSGERLKSDGPRQIRTLLQLDVIK